MKGLLGVVALLAGMSLVPASDAGLSGDKKCGAVTIRAEPYFVQASGSVTCGFARLWAAKLAPLKGKIGATGKMSITGHPAGYTCSGVPFNETKFPFQFSGSCLTVTPSQNSFVWTLRIR